MEAMDPSKGDAVVYIPLCGVYHNLNVATALSVAMCEYRRQWPGKDTTTNTNESKKRLSQAQFWHVVALWLYPVNTNPLYSCALGLAVLLLLLPLRARGHRRLVFATIVPF